MKLSGELSFQMRFSVIVIAWGTAETFNMNTAEKSLPDRYSEVFGGGKTFLGEIIEVNRTKSTNGYVYECPGLNSTIVRCREVFTQYSNIENRATGLQTAIINQSAGYISIVNGKVVINNLSTPLTWEGRSYFWDRQFYNEADEENKTMCYANIFTNDDAFKNLILKTTNTRPGQLVWGCPIDEYCCDLTCCSPRFKETGHFFTMCTLIMWMTFCFLFCRSATKFCRKEEPLPTVVESVESGSSSSSDQAVVEEISGLGWPYLDPTQTPRESPIMFYYPCILESDDRIFDGSPPPEYVTFGPPSYDSCVTKSMD